LLNAHCPFFSPSRLHIWTLLVTDDISMTESSSVRHKNDEEVGNIARWGGGTNTQQCKDMLAYIEGFSIFYNFYWSLVLYGMGKCYPRIFLNAFSYVLALFFFQQSVFVSKRRKWTFPSFKKCCFF
jgi:hypothetical protein